MELECECGLCMGEDGRRAGCADAVAALRRCQESHRRVLVGQLILQAARKSVETGTLPIEAAVKLEPFIYSEGEQDRGDHHHPRTPSLGLTDDERRTLKVAVNRELVARTNWILKTGASPTGAISPSDDVVEGLSLAGIKERCDEAEACRVRLGRLQERLAGIASSQQYAAVNSVLHNLANCALHLDADIREQKEKVVHEETKEKRSLAAGKLVALLRSKIEEVERGAEAAESRLLEYREQWPADCHLAAKYSELKAKIQRREWAIRELRNTMNSSRVEDL